MQKRKRVSGPRQVRWNIPWDPVTCLNDKTLTPQILMWFRSFHQPRSSIIFPKVESDIITFKLLPPKIAVCCVLFHISMLIKAMTGATRG